MGKDFTPHIHHVVDKEYGFSSQPLILTDLNTGEETVYRDPNCDDALRWPNSYFLASEILERHKSHPEVLDMFEQTLAKIISLDDAGSLKGAHLDTPLEKTVHQWYMGNLDPNFYYNTHNNELMSDALTKFET